jgi:uncharacterized repeat protein (TIGR01451 family)
MKILYCIITFVFLFLEMNSQWEDARIIFDPNGYNRLYTDKFLVDVDLDGDLDVLVNKGWDPFYHSLILVNDNLESHTTGFYINSNFFLNELYGLHFADLNGDQIVEAISTNDSQQLIWQELHLDNEAHNFQSYLIEELSQPIIQTLQDMDDDGDTDILLRDENSGVTENYWLVNNGNFDFSLTSLPGANFENFFDIDEDGDLDFLRFSVSGLELIENLGNNEFAEATFISTLDLDLQYVNFQFTDADSDGDLDLFMAGEIATYWVEQSSNMNFDIVHNIPICDYCKVFLAYVDHDDWLDVVTYTYYNTYESSYAQWQRNDGTGHFETREFSTQLRFAPKFNQDIDGDGNKDLFGLKEIDTDGFFDSFWMDVYSSEGDVVVHPSSYFISLQSTSININDVNEDGNLDISFYQTGISTESDTLNAYFPNLGNGNFGWPQPTELAHSDEIHMVDLWGDETNELVYLDSSGYLIIEENIGGTNQYQIAASIDVSNCVEYSNKLIESDLNSDGLTDFLVSSLYMFVPCTAQGLVFNYIINDGNGSFHRDSVSVTGNDIRYQRLIDMNYDGFKDLIISTVQGTYIYYYNGITFSESFMSPAFMAIHGCVDWDGDNDIDIVASQHAEGYYLESVPFVFFQDSSGSFGQSIVLQFEQLFNSYSYDRTLQYDMDNDGFDEILFMYYQQKRIFLTKNNGNGYETYEVEIPEMNFPNGIDYSQNQLYIFPQIGDLDNDNYPDILLSINQIWNFGHEGSIVWLRNNLGDGCTDPNACNYKQSAAIDNGSCCYNNCGCTDSRSCNFDPLALCDDGSCNLSGCTNSEACNYDPLAICDDGSCLIGQQMIVEIEPLYNQVAVDFYRVTFYNTLDSSLHYATFHSNQYGEEEPQPFCLPQGCWEVYYQAQGEFVDSTTFFVSIKDSTNLSLWTDTMQIDFFQQGVIPRVQFYYGVFSDMEFCHCTSSSVGGCIDPIAFNYNRAAECNDGSCMYTASGVVFFDANENGIMDDNEVGISNQTLTIDPGNVTVITNNNGEFYAPLLSGEYSVNHNYDLDFPFYTTADSQIMSVGNPEGSQNLYFGLSTQNPSYEICVDVYPDAPTYPCDVFVNHNICFRNMGNLPLNGTITLEFDELFQDFIYNSEIDSVNDNIIFMGFENLQPGEMFFYDIKLKTPDASYLGYFLDNQVNVYGYYNDQLVAQGVKNRVTELACAFDPNDKVGYPVGYTNQHFISDSTEVEYVIRFQNTGNAPASDVIIRDQLDESFDIESFRLVANSHSVMASINPDTREITFIFDEINLPDSVHNEPLSHGLLAYAVRLNSDLPHLTEVHNYADIYFDNNDPVITNTAQHTIYDCEELVLEILLKDSGNCSHPEYRFEAGVEWADQYAWFLDNAGEGNSDLFLLSDSGHHTVKLVILNELCGLRSDSMNVDLIDHEPSYIYSSDTAICANQWAQLVSNYSEGNSWFFSGLPIGYSQEINVNEEGYYSLVVTTENCIIDSAQILINVLEMPQNMIVTQSGNNLICSVIPDVTYQWFLNGTLIDGANGIVLNILESGAYLVVATNSEGCNSTGTIEGTYLNVAEQSTNTLSVYPNPAHDQLTIQIPEEYTNAIIRITQMDGKLIKEIRAAATNMEVEVKGWPVGNYNIQISNGTLPELNSILMVK